MNIILYILGYLLCSTIGLILLKISINGSILKSPSSFIDLLANYRFGLGFILYVTSFILWLFLLSRKDLSYIYPIVIGLSYLSIMCVSAIVLKESFTVGKAFGATLIGLGLIVIFFQK